MAEFTSSNKRIARNTLLLYFRMILLIFVQLYTVPIILKALGVEDYGIYNVVGGVVTLFSFVGSSLASGSQRFIAFEIGRGDNTRLKKVIDSTITIYFILAILSLILLEIAGYWFLNNRMNIPVDRMNASNWVFQLSVITFLVNLLSIPYNALVIAHERMSFFAYLSIFECLLKLIVAILLPYLLSDKLIVYAFLICLIAIILRIIYQLYCRHHFYECRHYHFSWKVYQGKELLIYSGWNMVGSVAFISKQQGLNVVINLFFGPLLNAAHSIAQQINGVLSQFINNIYIATRPQITKLYAGGNVEDMWKLVFSSGKLAFFLLMLITVPTLIEIETILNVWLHEVPPYTVPIARMMIISILIETLSNQVIGAYQAENKIKKYQLYSSTIILLNVPISYLALKLYPENPVIPYLLSALLSVVYVCSILWNAQREIKLDLKAYVRNVCLPNIVVYILVMGFVWACIHSFPTSFLRVVLTVCFSILFSFMTIWILGLNSAEKRIVKNVVRQKYKKWRNTK